MANKTRKVAEVFGNGKHFTVVEKVGDYIPFVVYQHTITWEPGTPPKHHRKQLAKYYDIRSAVGRIYYEI